MWNLIQTNKFSYISDEKNIFFSKIDLIDSVIQEIEKTKNICVLIIGNGDLPFTNEIEKKIPKNVIKIFAQNNISCSDRVESLPLGIGNSEACGKSGHGEHWGDVVEKVGFLTSIEKTNQQNLTIYCNFRDYTFPSHRGLIKEICKNLDFIKLDESNLNYTQFINNILRTSCNICPAGNGLDTHRLWETLYCYRIPITFRVTNTRSYYWEEKNKIGIYDDLYKNLPIIVLNDEKDLTDKSLLINKFKEAEKKWENVYLLDFKYWENKIKKLIS